MKKSKQPELKTVEILKLEDPVERLSIEGDGVDLELDDLELNISEVDLKLENVNVGDLDSLLREEKQAEDESLDLLFTDEKANKYDEVEVEVRKALYRPKSSNAQLIRAEKSAEAVNVTRSEEISSYGTMEDSWETDEGATVEGIKPIVYIAVLLLIALICGGVWALWNLGGNNQTAHQAMIEQRDEIRKEIEAKHDEVSREIEKIEKVILEYVEAKTPEDKMKYLYVEESLKSQMASYLRDPINEQKYKNLKIERVFEKLINGERVWCAICKYGVIFDKASDVFYFVKKSDGEYRIDWQSLVGFQNDDLVSFVNDQSTEPISCRVIVQPRIVDGHYNWGFKDTEYSAYRLKLDEQQILWGFMNNSNDELVKQMNQAVINNKPYYTGNTRAPLKMLLKVKFQENTNELNKQCVEIVEIVSPDWYLGAERKGEKVE